MNDQKTRKTEYLPPLLSGLAAGLFMLMCSCAVTESLVLRAFGACAGLVSVTLCGVVCPRLKAPHNRLAAFVPTAVMLCADILLHERFLTEAACAADEAAYRRALVSGEMFFTSAESSAPPLLMIFTACAVLCAVCTAFGREVSCALFTAAAVLYCTAFGGSPEACALMAFCVCIVLTGRHAPTKKGLVVIALTTAAVMSSSMLAESFERTPRFSGEVTAPQGQPLYLMHEVVAPDTPAKAELCAESEKLYKLTENGFYPQLQAQYLINAANTAEASGEVTLPENAPLVPSGVIAADGTPLKTFDCRGFEKGTRSFTVCPLFYRDVFLLSADLEYEKNADYLRCEALVRELAYERFANISPEDSELISGYVSADLTAPQYKRLEAVSRFISTRISPSPESKELTLEEMLSRRTADPNGIVHLSVMLLRNSGLAAREVRGCYFKVFPQSGKADLKDAEYRTWAEVYIDGAGWIPFEPSGEYALPLPALPAGKNTGGEGASPLPPQSGEVIITQPKLTPSTEQDKDEPLTQAPEIRLFAVFPLMLLLWCGAVNIIRLAKKRRIFGNDTALSIKTAHTEALRILEAFAPLKDLPPEDIPEALEKTLGRPLAEKYTLSRRAYEKLLYSPAAPKKQDAESSRSFYLLAKQTRRSRPL